MSETSIEKELRIPVAAYLKEAYTFSEKEVFGKTYVLIMEKTDIEARLIKEITRNIEAYRDDKN